KSKTIGYVRQKDIDEARYPEMIVNMARKTEFIARADVVNLLHVNEDKHITARRGDPAGCFFNHKKLIQGLLKIGQRIYYIFDRIV
ncbi:MAG: hypothetical protein PUC62_08035, partial [Oscillospiraceae bacterium]|nr:hypothetical protein [Oscillospiraceae bacterium]